MKKKKIKTKEKIAKAKGKLGVLIPGIGGAVATTFMAGVEAIKSRTAMPIGSLTQMGTVRLGKRDEDRIPLVKDFIDLAALDDLSDEVDALSPHFDSSLDQHSFGLFKHEEGELPPDNCLIVTQVIFSLESDVFHLFSCQVIHEIILAEPEKDILVFANPLLDQAHCF